MLKDHDFRSKVVLLSISQVVGYIRLAEGQVRYCTLALSKIGRGRSHNYGRVLYTVLSGNE